MRKKLLYRGNKDIFWDMAFEGGFILFKVNDHKYVCFNRTPVC